MTTRPTVRQVPRACTDVRGTADFLPRGALFRFAPTRSAPENLPGTSARTLAAMDHGPVPPTELEFPAPPSTSRRPHGKLEVLGVATENIVPTDPWSVGTDFRRTSGPSEADPPATFAGASLVPDETTQHLTLDASQSFRHSGWNHLRTRLHAAMKNADLPWHRIYRFAECGKHAWVEGDGPYPERWRIRCSTCRDRWCLPCQQARGRAIAHRLAKLCSNTPTRFITLTKRHDLEPLDVAIDAVLKSYARLRRSKLWKSTVKAAAAVLEITRNTDTQTWHPHLHILAKGKFIPQEALSHAWLKATGDSPVVDIRLARTANDAANYVCKYVTKPMGSAHGFSDDDLVEAIQALKGTRMITLTGEWHALPQEEEPDKGNWFAIAPLPQILEQAAAGEPSAILILNFLRRRSPCAFQPCGPAP